MPDREYLLLSATEPDRSGLVAELTGFIDECGGNVDDSRVVVLGGHAGLMVLVSGEAAVLERLVAGLGSLRERTGIRAAPRRVAARRTSAEERSTRIDIEASALDHEGIIHALADTVRRHGGNILELESSTEAAPMSGEPLLTLHMSVWADPDHGADTLWRELERVAEQEGVELAVCRVPTTDEHQAAVGAERRRTTRPD
ncbi:MAG: glycine cleavage system protein R [Gemmatimonadales bacterium]